MFYDVQDRCISTHFSFRIVACLAGLATYGVGSLLFLFALQTLPVVVAAPLFATTLLFSLLFGILFFREPVSRMRVLGSLLIVVGVAVITRA